MDVDDPREIDTESQQRALWLIALVPDPSEPESRLRERMDELKVILGCPHVADLIFWEPPGLSDEEVVERALAYRPIAL